MTAGLPLREPPELNASAGAKALPRLVAERTRFDLAGRAVWGDSYNGSFVGPTIHLTAGERVRLTLVNHLPVITNLHFHGMHLSPTGAQDNPFVTVLPGQSFSYRLKIPANHDQGTFWYHDHGMAMTPGSDMPVAAPTGSVGADLESQLFAGLSGTILVGDDRRLLPARLRHVVARTLVFKDVQIDREGRIAQNTATGSINSNNPTVRLVNGQLRPVLTIRPRETQLWRLANEGADIFYRLHLDGYRFTVIGEDGVPVARITSARTLLLAPGNRYDVLVRAHEHRGGSWLRTLAYSNGPQGDSYPDVPLLKLRVSGRAVRALAAPAGSLPTAPASLAKAPIARHRTLTLSENSGGTSFYINERQFSPESSIFSTPGVVGTVEQWKVLNSSGESHPFHIHTNHFQVMSINGHPQPYTGQRDIVLVPHAQNGVPGQVVLRIALADFPGKWMFHCHIDAHSDNGMMSYLNVIAHPARAKGRAAPARTARSAR